jgi:hypothetical protein
LQTGLIDQILRVTGSKGTSVKTTSTDTTPLGVDKDYPTCEEKWSYESVAGILI